MTRRERDVLALAAAGLSNAAIARELGVSRDAVRFHLKHVHALLGTRGDRARLAALAAGGAAAR
ncbi:MAG: helix-turn-helix domain-containing protein [Hyphomicrobiales bacterium]